MKNWIYYIPRSALSRLVGVLAEIRFIAPLSTWILGLFVRLTGIKMEESEKPLANMRSVQEVFTRRLKPGIREVCGSICSPADGRLNISEALSGDQATQVKGQMYSLKALCFGDSRRPHDQHRGTFCWQFTVYLAPHNYHRVHSPVAGKLQKIRYIPGERWPVNQKFVGLVPALFVKNERAVFEIEISAGLKAYVVMVAALNVGKILSSYWPEIELDAKASSLTGATTSKLVGAPISLGDELGVFALGSTVVTVFEHQGECVDLGLRPSSESVEICMGQSLSDK